MRERRKERREREPKRNKTRERVLETGCRVDKKFMTAVKLVMDI